MKFLRRYHILPALGIALFISLFFPLIIPAKSTPKLIGHRGYSGKYTENSVESMARAYVSGFDGVEMDVWEANDHTLWVFHDENLKNLTGKKGKIYDITYENQADYRLKNGTAIPTLDDMLQLLQNKDRIFIHIKGDSHRNLTQTAKNNIISTVQKYHLENKVYIFAGKGMMSGPNADFGKIKTGWLIFKKDSKKLKSIVRKAKKKKVNFILLYRMKQYKARGNGAAFIAYAHKYGIKAGLYWTKKRSNYKYLSRINADFALSDNYVK